MFKQILILAVVAFLTVSAMPRHHGDHEPHHHEHLELQNQEDDEQNEKPTMSILPYLPGAEDPTKFFFGGLPGFQFPQFPNIFDILFPTTAAATTAATTTIVTEATTTTTLAPTA